MHEVLRALAERLGPEVFDDPDNFRGALDDVLDEDAGLGDQNLVTDAVRLGAYASMIAMLRQGGDPTSTVAQAGVRLARDRGGDDTISASWACACLAYAVGAVGVAEVQSYRTVRREPSVAPPPPAPPTQAAPPLPPPQPVPPPPEPLPPPVGGRWLVPVLVVIALVAAVTVGVLAASRLGDGDDPATTTATDPPISDPTTASTPTEPTDPTTPTSDPTTPTTPPTSQPTSTGPTPIATRVEYTCGNGDCFVSERAGPRADAGEVGSYDEGDTVRVLCQVVGQEISSSLLGRSSRVWARTTNGGFVAAIFLAGIDKFRVTTPCP
jgi:hypothetical protein